MVWGCLSTGLQTSPRTIAADLDFFELKNQGWRDPEVTTPCTPCHGLKGLNEMDTKHTAQLALLTPCSLKRADIQDLYNAFSSMLLIFPFGIQHRTGSKPSPVSRPITAP
jgi:hypothetical protein